MNPLVQQRRLRQQSSGISDCNLQMSDFFTAICHIIFDRRRQAHSVDVSCPALSSAKVDRSENNASTLYTIQPCYLRLSKFAFSLNISLKIRSSNESRLFSGSRHSGVKLKIKQSVVK